jgi:D-arabinose 1-dehydrogenase-like Zn-dependent alcohol dehydrogenase
MNAYEKYVRADSPLPKSHRLWPLYGQGLENFGREGQPIDVPLPECGPDDLLVRHDVCSLCFSDVKAIRQGQNHPRIMKNMATDPVVLGHELCMTVVAVGENLKDEYQIGDRLTLQTDIYLDGVGFAYGYMYQGGLSQYTVIPPEIRNTDNGDMLIPLPEGMGYAEAGLIEPWACVVAAYQLEYRQHIKTAGRTWIIGDHETLEITEALIEHTPKEVAVTDIHPTLEIKLKTVCRQLGIALTAIPEISEAADESFDDIILLNPEPAQIEQACKKLAQHGILCILKETPLEAKVAIDVGRIHYHRWLIVGGTDGDIRTLYQQTPVRAELKPGGKAWFAGAGGPIGRMHVQRALQLPDPPGIIFCTDIDQDRLDDLEKRLGKEASAKGVNLICANPQSEVEYLQAFNDHAKDGFDDIIVLAPVPALVSECSARLADHGVMNIFAGIRRGTLADLDLNPIITGQARVIGHSGSQMADMLLVLQRWQAGELSTNRSVAAVGSLEAAKEGYQALMDARYPGKVVLYPHIKAFPLTSLPDLAKILPSVYKKLTPSGEWTREAEIEFLAQMLPQEDE